MKEPAPGTEANHQIVADVTLRGLGPTPLPWTIRFDSSGFNILVPWANAERSVAHDGDVYPIDKASVPHIYRVIFEVPAGDEARAKDVSDKEYIQERLS